MGRVSAAAPFAPSFEAEEASRLRASSSKEAPLLSYTDELAYATAELWEWLLSHQRPPG